MKLSDIDIAKFKAGFNQFSSEEIRLMFSTLKAMVDNSEAAAPLEMSVNEQEGIRLSLAMDLGILAKAKANIADGATGAVVLTDLLFAEIGDEFDAKNFTGSAVTNGDTKLQIGRDPSGQPFFRKTEGTAVCGPGDCPDSCVGSPLCFDVSWSIFGGSSGLFTVPVTVDSVCVQFQDPGANPNGFGSVQDPVTGRGWTLTVEWDTCAQMILYTLEDCAGIPVPIDEILGGTISAPDCGVDIDVTIAPAGPQPCSVSNTFPCCDALEGCTCG